MVLILNGNSEIGTPSRKLQSVFDLFKAYDWTESNHKSFFFSHECATCSKLPSS